MNAELDCTAFYTFELSECTAIHQPSPFQILIFVGNASALSKKGANESLIDMNHFRDIFIKVIEPHKEDQADPELGESSKRTYI